MSKAAIFTMKLESDLRADFMAEAQACHRPASQVMRDLMRGFVQEQRDARAHAGFLDAKVAAARASVDRDIGRSNDSVEADFARRRAGVDDPA